MGIAIPKEVEDLGQLYEIEVNAIEFLAYNDHLIPFLQEMAPVLASYFPGSPLRLHLERDPETGREMELWALAIWRDGNDGWMEALERLDRFRREWWFHNSSSVRRQLAVNFQFAEVQTP